MRREMTKTYKVLWGEDLVDSALAINAELVREALAGGKGPARAAGTLVEHPVDAAWPL